MRGEQSPGCDPQAVLRMSKADSGVGPLIRRDNMDCRLNVGAQRVRGYLNFTTEAIFVTDRVTIYVRRKDAAVSAMK